MNGQYSLSDTDMASALTTMTQGTGDLNESAKNFMTTLENDVFRNLSGTSVQNFITKSNTHCENIAKVAKDLQEITNILSSIRNSGTDSGITVSRNG